MTQSRAIILQLGEVFGRLTVLGPGDPGGKYKVWQVRCQCGAVLAVPGYRLTSGTVKSCGCLRRERMAGLWLNHEHRRRWREAVTAANRKKARVHKVAYAKPEALHPDDRPERKAAFTDAALIELAKVWT